MKDSITTKSGFTLIELLVVIAIVGILAALMTRGVFGAIEAARSVECKNNLRNMIQAAHVYAADNKGELPPAIGYDSNGTEKTWEDFLWGYDSRADNATARQRVHQCPSLRGGRNRANWKDDRYTGYNYNTSYIGGERGSDNGVTVNAWTLRSANLASITSPDTCAVFGDGEYGGGANKFMRSPMPGPMDIATSVGNSLAAAGTQGFRHRGKTTNVAFADGTVRSIDTCFDKGFFGDIGKGCGFLSPDNSAYSLDGSGAPASKK